MIKCPSCGVHQARVVWTQQTADGVSVRRRHCGACDRRWYGAQAVEVEVPSFAVTFNRRGPAKLNLELLTLEQRQQIVGSQCEDGHEPV